MHGFEEKKLDVIIFQQFSGKRLGLAIGILLPITHK